VLPFLENGRHHDQAAIGPDRINRKKSAQDWSNDGALDSYSFNSRRTWDAS
jgi:hypothetical protein